MDLRFQKAEEKDADILVCLRKRIWLSTYRGIYPDELLDEYDAEYHKRRDLMRIRDTHYHVYLIVKEKPIGYFYFEHKQTLHIQSLYILKEHQREGIGTRVFSFIREYCRINGLKEFTCNCNEHNLSARGFYEHLGGKIIRIETGHENKREDQITYLFQTENQDE